jgi:hypothetical protein
MTNEQPFDYVDVNPSPDSTGLEMFEHWEKTDRGYYLLDVSSSGPAIPMKPGDIILTRTWAPAGEPSLYNRAGGAS